MSLRDKLVGPTEEEILHNLKDLSSDKLLIKSCRIPFLKGVEIALEKGANVHFDGDMSLRYSSIKGHTDIVKLLLENGADVYVNNNWCLKQSSKKGYTEVVELLKTYIK